jgi:ABC-2 type transport system permease protein
MSLINSKKDGEEYISEVTKFTIYDETGLAIDYSQALQGDAYKGVQIVTDSAQSYDAHVKALEDSEESTELVAKIVFNEIGLFNVTFVKAAGADLSDEDCNTLAGDFVAYFQDARISAIDVTTEQIEFINQPVVTKVEFINETGEIIPQKEKKEGISMEEYMVLLMGIMIVTMIVSLSGGSIATSIVTEKTTRVVEYLMINVRPMALIVGKILASLVMVFVQFAAMGISYFISTLLNTMLF